ncbi:hypothetical protein PInf_009778 [Phytophthora infestans]|nr:hypothetical protein PInf_009778 [Phytophthora infestans]
MSPAKRISKSPGKAPSTTPPVSPSMSPTDLWALAQALSDQVRTLTAELQTAQDTRDQAQRAEAAAQQAYQSLSTSSHATQRQTLRAQVHDQAMEIQGWEHRAASRSQDLRPLLADQAVEIRDLTRRLDRASRQRDGMRDDNDHLLREMALARSEIHQLQTRIHGLERDLDNCQAASAAADESLDRLRDELRLTQEEVVTNDYVGSTHGGFALGSARGGPPAPNPPPSSLDVALAHYAPEEFVRMTQARDEIQAKLTDTELQRDKAATEWADAKRTQTELESKIRRMTSILIAPQSPSGAGPSVAKQPRSVPPAPGTGSPRPHKQARASPKTKPKTGSASKAVPKTGSTPTPKPSVSSSRSGTGSKTGSVAASKSGSASKTGSVASSKSGSGSKAGSTAAVSKSGSGSKPGSAATSKTGSTASKSGSTVKTGSTAAPMWFQLQGWFHYRDVVPGSGFNWIHGNCSFYDGASHIHDQVQFVSVGIHCWPFRDGAYRSPTRFYRFSSCRNWIR